MRYLLWTLLLFMWACAAQAQVYKWTDEKGTVHFSDKPPAHLKTETVRSVDTQIEPELRMFCTRLRQLLPSLLGSAQFGASRNLTMEQARRDEDRLKDLGITGVDLQRLVDAIYAYNSEFRNPQGAKHAIDDIHSRCTAGVFGDFKVDASAKTDADGTPVLRERASSGTGFLIAADLVATSLHVIDGSRGITVYLSDGSSVSASSVGMDRSKDLALLKLARPTEIGFLRVASDTVGLGAEVFTIGFPQPDLMGIEPKLANGIISATSGIQDDQRTYQISVPVQSGNSGGPLVDTDGRVVGIVASKLNAAKVFEWTGDLPQNVSYAVKSVYLARLMSDDTLRAGVPVAGNGLQARAAAVKAAVVRIEAR